MATFYVGPRPVLKGRSSAQMSNPYTSMTGKAKGTGTYSYYPLYSTSHVLDGAPDNHNIPGTGARPGNRFLSQVFNGTTLYVHPLANPTEDGYGNRFKPNEYKGLAGAAAFSSGYGHDANAVNAYTLYSNFKFDGVTSAQALSNVGHGKRDFGATGVPNSFGYFVPEEFHGVTSVQAFPSTFGQAIPAGYDNAYGHNRVQEYRGVPSARAL